MKLKTPGTKCKGQGCANKSRRRGYCVPCYAAEIASGRMQKLRAKPNTYTVVGPHTEISLYDKTGSVCAVALIDSEDASKVAEYHWHKGSAGYVCSNKAGFLHRFIIKEAKCIDHTNRNKLDCRKHNLRRCTSSQNNMNRWLRSDNKSGFIGVSKSQTGGKWVAHAGVNGKAKHLGRYKCRLAAAWSYNKEIEKLHGDFALFNSIIPGEYYEAKCLPSAKEVM